MIFISGDHVVINLHRSFLAFMFKGQSLLGSFLRNREKPNCFLMLCRVNKKSNIDSNHRLMGVRHVCGIIRRNLNSVSWQIMFIGELLQKGIGFSRDLSISRCSLSHPCYKGRSQHLPIDWNNDNVTTSLAPFYSVNNFQACFRLL